MTDFNVSLGKGKDVQKLSSEDLKGGVSKLDIEDTQMQSIFSMLDENRNGILENTEIDKIKDAVSKFAQQNGKSSILSKKEAKHLISSLGLKGIKAEDLFRFLGSIKLAASNIVSQTLDSDGSKAINVEYKADQEGNRVTIQYNPTTGVFIGSYTVDKNNNVLWQDASGKIIKGKNDVGNFNRTYNPDGSYTDTYEDRIRNYDAEGRWVSGTATGGITYTKEYHEDGSYTSTYSNGKVEEYDKNNKQLSGKLPNGTTWKNEYHEDGSYTKTYSDGEVREHDKNGKPLSGKLANGTTYEYKYNEQGKLEYEEFSEKDGSKYYYSADGKSYAEKTASGDFFVSPKQGETFDDTMNRLGITDPADQELFKESNQEAFERGYFILTDPGKAYGEVYIPKSIADKLDINNVLVDETAEAEKHKQARKKPSIGV